MKNSLFRYVCLVVALLICSFADAQQKANYKLAEKFRLLEQNPIIKYSTEVKPTFINGTDCFYYSFTTREGKKYYYVNPKKKEKRLLFDTAELLSKIAVYTKKAYSSADPYLSFTFMKDNETIRIDFDDFTNTKSGMQEVAKDDTFASDFLGGQNPFTYFSPVAENIKIAPLSAYDQGCVELIQNAFSDYFQGQVDYDKAKSNFETAIKERYPEIQEVNWAE